jgi:alkylation response protein AidB-like acyl-CoA dehydrogenase
VQEEVWGADPDTWMASPYAPNGRARPVDDGFVLEGRWQFSSGTDHCDWIFLGGLVTDQEGNLAKPLDVRHFVLPRRDYEIVEDSWNVVGLRGTGSKDVVVDKAFVPLYRTVQATKVLDGTATVEAGRQDSALYRTPWSAIFPPAITAAVIGIAEGALAAHVAYQRDRVSMGYVKVADDPWAQSTIGEAASEIRSCRVQLLDNIGSLFDMAARGEEVSLSQRAAARRDQVRASWRAVRAVDTIFDHSGGNALRMDQPLQRFWRDAHAGLHHAINAYGPIYSAYSKMEMGRDPGNVFGLTI